VPSVAVLADFELRGCDPEKPYRVIFFQEQKGWGRWCRCPADRPANRWTCACSRAAPPRRVSSPLTDAHHRAQDHRGPAPGACVVSVPSSIRPRRAPPSWPCGRPRGRSPLPLRKPARRPRRSGRAGAGPVRPRSLRSARRLIVVSGVSEASWVVTRLSVRPGTLADSRGKRPGEHNSVLPCAGLCYLTTRPCRPITSGACWRCRLPLRPCRAAEPPPPLERPAASCPCRTGM
jgi:hypothetical protein